MDKDAQSQSRMPYNMGKFENISSMWTSVYWALRHRQRGEKAWALWGTHKLPHPDCRRPVKEIPDFPALVLSWSWDKLRSLYVSWSFWKSGKQSSSLDSRLPDTHLQNTYCVLELEIYIYRTPTVCQSLFYPGTWAFSRACELMVFHILPVLGASWVLSLCMIINKLSASSFSLYFAEFASSAMLCSPVSPSVAFSTIQWV